MVDEGQRRDLLRQAEDELHRIINERGWGSPQSGAARQRLLALERSTAAEMGLPYAEPADLGVKWDAGAPMPVLISGLRTFVAFYLSDSEDDYGIGVVEFKRVTSVKMGSPNDEALRGHPLRGSGLEPYQAHKVRNSTWITELMDVNRVHSAFQDSYWSAAHHYVLTFHDETLECVAQATDTRTEPAATMPEVMTSLGHQALAQLAPRETSHRATSCPCCRSRRQPALTRTPARQSLRGHQEP